MTTTHRFVLRFNTDIGHILRFSIPRARADKIAENARTSMEAMLTNGAVASDKGIASGIYGAQIVTTQTRPVA